MKKYVVLDIETTGLNPWYGDIITCICAKDNEGNRFNTANSNLKLVESEYYLIDEFYFWMHFKISSEYLLITKNGKLFDIPFILSRITVLGKKFPYDPYYKLLSYRHFDLQEITSKRVGLDDMAKLLGCKQKIRDGKNAIRLWQEKNYEELVKYCENDVDVTEEVYLKYIKLSEEKNEQNGQSGLCKNCCTHRNRSYQ